MFKWSKSTAAAGCVANATGSVPGGFRGTDSGSFRAAGPAANNSTSDAWESVGFVAAAATRGACDSNPAAPTASAAT